MDTAKLKWGVLFTCLSIFLMPFTCEAQIYKWVDSAGHTHYSETKEEAGRAKAQEVKISARSATGQAPNQSTQSWKDNEKEFEERQRQGLAEQAPSASTDSAQGSFSKNPYREESDAAKCNLARDVLNGSARHADGAKTDQYDREVAESDVRSFCR